MTNVRGTFSWSKIVKEIGEKISSRFKPPITKGTDARQPQGYQAGNLFQNSNREKKVLEPAQRKKVEDYKHFLEHSYEECS